MAARILVAYATQHGSTAGIAEAIGKELVAAGYAVDVADIKSVNTLSTYDAVVIGAPLYMGRMDGTFGQFVGRYRDELSKRPLAVFAVGLTPFSKDPAKIQEVEKLLLTAITPLQPVSLAVFAGSLDPAKLSFIQRKMSEMVKSPVGDFRDWEAIGKWARELAELFKA